METAEVVIVGGGVMGASVAYHLTELGITDVVLLERETLASGSTSKSAGGIRAQFADDLNIRIALRSIDEFAAFGERLGAEIEFEQSGYLFLLDNSGDVERFRAALALQHSLGVPSRELTVTEAAEIVPQLDTDGPDRRDVLSARRPRDARGGRVRLRGRGVAAGRAGSPGRAGRGDRRARRAHRRGHDGEADDLHGHGRVHGGRVVARGRRAGRRSTFR